MTDTSAQHSSEPKRDNDGTWISWNRNIIHPYSSKISAGDEADIQKAVIRSSNIRPTGTGQSSADIVAGTDSLIDMRSYNKIQNVDRKSRRITVESGIILSELLEVLNELHWTIPCLPDNDSITLGGAIATGTHGTTGGGKTLSQYMVACRMVDGQGNIHEYSENHDHLNAIRVSVGVLGIFTEITLQCQETQELLVREEPVKDEVWLENWEDWLESNYFLRLLWIPHSGYAYKISGIPLKDAEAQAAREGGRVHTKNAPDFIKHRREFSRILYSWDNPAFTRFSNRLIRRLFFNHTKVHTGNLYDATVTKKRSSTLELAEWTVAREEYTRTFLDFRQALAEDKQAYAHIPMDIRFLQADASWLSNAYQRDIVTMGCVTRKPESADQYRAFDIIEEQFLSHKGRPHWAKRFKADRSVLEELYPRYGDFAALRKELDPKGRFLNPYLARLFS